MFTRRLFANILGTAWSAVLMVAIVPLYIRYLGVAAYGVVGLYVALLAIIAVVDFGLGTVVNREFAAALTVDDRRSAAALTATVHAVFWILALLFAVLLAALAGPIADSLGAPQGLPRAQLVSSLRLMAVAIGLQFPFTFYAAALLGLQRHVSYNVVAFACGATLRVLITIVALVLVRPSLGVFFSAQAVGNGLQTGLVAWLYLREAPRVPANVAFGFGRLRPVWRFALSASAITMLPILFSQVDKLVLSQVVPLQALGHYAIATAIASGFGFLASPYFVTLFPRSTELIRTNDHSSLAHEYHRAVQFLGATVCPLVAVLIVFAEPVVAVWTGSNIIARDVAPILRPLVAAYALNAMLVLPNALLLAGKGTRLPAVVNSFGVILLIPVVALLGRRLGASAAAYGRAAISLFIILATLQLAHRTYLRTDETGGFVDDVARPFLVSFFMVFVAHAFLTVPSTRTAAALELVSIGGATFAAAIVVTPHARAYFRRLGRRRPLTQSSGS